MIYIDLPLNNHYITNISLSVNTLSHIFLSDRNDFLSTFRAYNLLLSFFLTNTTLAYAPLPITDIRLKD